MSGGEIEVKSRKSTIAKIEERKELRYIFGEWTKQINRPEISKVLIRLNRRCSCGKRMFFTKQAANDAVRDISLKFNKPFHAYEHNGVWHLSRIKPTPK